MSEAWGNFAGVITLVLMAVFIGIWIWAWRARHKRTFDRMARMPMEDKDAGNEPPPAEGDEDKEEVRK